MDGDDSRVALVTGGVHGIGAGIAARLARDGWRVVVADIRAGKPPAAGIRLVNADVSNEPQANELIQGIAAREGRLDALICNAGLMIRKPIAELTLGEWSSVIGLNLTSTFLLVR